MLRCSSFNTVMENSTLKRVSDMFCIVTLFSFAPLLQVISESLPVALAMAPIIQAGTAMKKQPKEPTNDNIWACLLVRAERTRWKYTWKGKNSKGDTDNSEEKVVTSPKKNHYSI